MTISPTIVWNEVRGALSRCGLSGSLDRLQAGGKSADERARLGLNGLELALFHYEQSQQIRNRRPSVGVQLRVDRTVSLRAYRELKMALAFGNFPDRLKFIDSLGLSGSPAIRAHCSIHRLAAALAGYLSLNEKSSKAVRDIFGPAVGLSVPPPDRRPVLETSPAVAAPLRHPSAKDVNPLTKPVRVRRCGGPLRAGETVEVSLLTGGLVRNVPVKVRPQDAAAINGHGGFIY